MNHNKLRVYLTTWLIGIAFSFSYLQAQTSRYDREVSILTDRLAKVLNSKGYKGKILVKPFTNVSGQPTELGVLLSGIVQDHMVNNSISYSVISNDAIVPKNPNSGRALKNTINSMGSKASDLLENESNTGSNDNDLGDYIESGASVLGNVLELTGNPNKKKYKKVDGLLNGTITEVGDVFHLHLSVNDLKKNIVLATSKGDIQNTQPLGKLDQTVDKPQAKNNTYTVAENNIYRSNIISPFRKDPFLFELLECYQQSNYLELKLRVISKEENSTLTIWGGGNTKIFDQNGGKEYTLSQARLADKIGNASYGITKELINDTPVNLTLTFTPNKDIDVISSLYFKCVTNTAGTFFVQMKNILVSR
ncbi:MAG: hypothetical protein AAF655_10865 [Bacteroidota bacterium]